MDIASDVPRSLSRRGRGLNTPEAQRQCVGIELGRCVGALHCLAAIALHKQAPELPVEPAVRALFDQLRNSRYTLIRCGALSQRRRSDGSGRLRE